MFSFQYFADDWADVVVSQLETALSADSSTWGYACICVGRELDEFIDKNYAAVNDVTGEFFHVFSLRSPPRDFVMSRIAEAQRAGNYGLAARLESVARRNLEKPGHEVRHKVHLLQDLARAGLDADKYADFLFLDFRPGDGDFEIDIIAAKVAPRNDLSDDVSMLALFKELSEHAGQCTAEGLPVGEFVKRATWGWDYSVALTRSMKLFDFVRAFIKKFASP